MIPGGRGLRRAVAALAGCGGAPLADDLAAYTAVVADPYVEVEAGRAGCARVADEELRGDCLLFVATIEARRSEGRPGRVCAGMDAGPFRDECWFVTAEALRRRGRHARAAEACRRAEAFVDDCGQHLWQSDLRVLVERHRGEGFAAMLPQARALHDHWAPLLAEGTDFERRFWARFFGNGFELAGRPELAWCDALTGDDAERCEAAALEFYGREIGPRLDRAGIDPCTLPEATAAALAPWFPAPADPRLDAVAAAVLGRRCRVSAGASRR